MPELGGVSHELLDVGDLRVHVASAGDPDADPLILLHGWPQHWWVWRKLIGPLSQEYRVICPDLRGFGWTDAPRGPYLKATLADDVLGLADTLGLDTFRLAGHDWGGFAGFHVCIKQPARVSHYLAAGIAHLWVGASSPSLWRRIGITARLWYQLPLAAPLLGRQLVQRVPFTTRAVLKYGHQRPGTFTDDDLDTFVSQWAEPDRARVTVRIYRSSVTRELPAVALGRYDDLVMPQPTVILLGEHDPVIKADTLRGVEANLPDCEIRELPGVGHFVPEEAPEETLSAMLDLFRR